MEAVVGWSTGYAPADVSGSAFLMQRELQWFEVKKDESDPSSESLKWKPTNERRGKTYWEVFVEQRKAILITTVAFAAAFTVPGGNDNNTGLPIFLKKNSFMVFMIADALALFSSITATLMFLAILITRYAPNDFLRSLPRKMILGLTFLFLSLAFMLVAFGSALMIVLSERWKWIYIPITLLAAIPIVLFAILQLPLYVEMVESTYCPRLYRPMKIWK
ncbi:hypothetical protein EUGRSUZ_C03638 [Eucalyptus grandis]|uniref:Uncharacterized protein n=2 Tax=Eucalyptus grandis TaxID=71139 RepID=A0ACC3LK92_EUCGR|nr:hypothetical protein EUGRSUZ_C03638 [Eucalyptus grandis]